MPRKTRKQYKKKNKRGGMKTIKDMAENMKQKASNMGNDMKKTASNMGDKVSKMAMDTKKKTTGFFKFPDFSFFRKKQPEKPPGEKMISRESAPEQMGDMGQRQMGQRPMGGKRKSRRFIKKKGKVTLQGGRRIRSRKSKTRCRTRRRR